MPQRNEDVVGLVRGLVRKIKGRRDDAGAGDDLYGEGLGLDSLDTAELADLLQEEMGSDPFSEGLTPQSIEEVAAYYEEKQ